MKREIDEVLNKNRDVRTVAKDIGLSIATIKRYVKHAHEAMKKTVW